MQDFEPESPLLDGVMQRCDVIIIYSVPPDPLLPVQCLFSLQLNHWLTSGRGTFLFGGYSLVSAVGSGHPECVSADPPAAGHHVGGTAAAMTDILLTHPLVKLVFFTITTIYRIQ